MNISKIKLFLYGIGILVAYAYGIITSQYKIYPYKEIREIKKLIIGNTSVNSSNNYKNNTYLTSNYLHKKSFFEEHGHEVEIVMVGDSITDSAEWRDLFPSKEIADQGIGGDTTAGVLDRIDLIYKAKPEKVFIMTGINDLFEGKNIDEIKNSYQKIVSELIKNNIKTYIQSTLLVGNNHEEINNKVILLNNILEDYADTDDLITYIDLNAVLSNGSFLIDEYSSDGKTLNGKGYKIWRDTISPYIM